MLKNSQKEIRESLEIVAKPDNLPLAFHCEFGKDRTGVLAALILTCAGVSEEDICADYALSEDFTRSRSYATQTESKGMPERMLGPAGYNFLSSERVFHLVAVHKVCSSSKCHPDPLVSPLTAPPSSKSSAVVLPAGGLYAKRVPLVSRTRI